MLGEDINKQMSSQKALVSSGWPAETLVGMKRDVALRSEEEDKPSENGKDGNCSARAERSTATDFLLMSPPGLRPDRSPQNWFSRLPTSFLLLQSRVQVCVYMVKTSQIPDDITLKCTTSTTIANRPGCFQSTWKLHFLGFLPAQICSEQHKYARCIFVLLAAAAYLSAAASHKPSKTSSPASRSHAMRPGAQLVQGDLQSPGSLIMFHDHVMETAPKTACFFFL